MSNYPPGVSGNEPQIAGPDAERDEQRFVQHECDEDKYDQPFEGWVTATITYWDRYSPLGVWFECPVCHEEIEYEEETDWDE